MPHFLTRAERAALEKTGETIPADVAAWLEKHATAAVEKPPVSESHAANLHVARSTTN